LGALKIAQISFIKELEGQNLKWTSHSCRNVAIVNISGEGIARQYPIQNFQINGWIVMTAIP
jgi:hypothetical protein